MRVMGQKDEKHKKQQKQQTTKTKGNSNKKGHLEIAVAVEKQIAWFLHFTDVITGGHANKRKQANNKHKSTKHKITNPTTHAENAQNNKKTNKRKGTKSLWMTLAEWMYLRPLSI